MRRPGDKEERQLKQTHRDRHPFDPAVRPRKHHHQQCARGDRQRDIPRQSIQLAHAGHAGEFRQQRPDRRDPQSDRRHPGPNRPERVADQLTVATAGEDRQTDRQFLHHIKNWHQGQLQQQQPIAPLHAALPGRDNATDVGVGQHHHKPGAEYRHESAQPGSRAKRRVRSQGGTRHLRIILNRDARWLTPLIPGVKSRCVGRGFRGQSELPMYGPHDARTPPA